MLRNFDSLCYENKIHLLLESFVIFNKNIQNSNLFLLKKKIKMIIVRINFDLNPEQEWTQAQKARTINL